MLAGFFAAAVLSKFGWSSLFMAGGLGAVGFGLLLGVSLPETPRFLARHSRTWPELAALLRRLSQPVGPAATFVDPAERAATGPADYRALFAGSLLRDTLSLWTAGLVCFWVVYCVFSWLPTALNSGGLSPAMASYGLAAWNLGGIFGALLCAGAVTRFGSRAPLAVCCIGAAIASFLLRNVSVLEDTRLMIYGLGIHGFFVNAVQSLLFALCAFVYPTSIRATGTASAIAFGRLGAIGSAFGGVYLINRGGASGFLGMLSLSMLLVLAGLLIGKRRIPALAPRTSHDLNRTPAS
jgi:AAHS family 4-hydroxybenzoate transporter-like MFS transporter